MGQFSAFECMNPNINFPNSIGNIITGKNYMYKLESSKGQGEK